MSELAQILSPSNIVGFQEVEFYPISPLSAGDPIQFDIPETLTQLTDPNFFLKITVKITEGDGTPLKDNAIVAPCNLALHGIFRDVILKANGTILNQATGTYPYRAYFETNYTYSTAAKNGIVGIPQLYYKETAGKFNTITLGENPGLDSRIKKFVKSKEVELGGRLHLDLCLQSKLLIPGVKYSITLIPSVTQFHVFSGTANAAEKMILTKIVLKIRRLNLASNAILHIEKFIQQKPITYPVRHAVVRTAHVSPGQSFISNFVLSSGLVPRIIILTFIESASFQGVYSRNPFNFSLKNCLSAQISVNGNNFPPLPYTPKISMIEPYINSLKIVNKLYTDSDTGLNLDDFQLNGHPILAFDLFPQEAGIPLKLNGVVTFSGQWPSTAFDDNYIMLYYLVFDSVISIDSYRNIILDYIP